MKDLNPSLVLLSVIGLAAGILLMSDGRTTSFEAQPPASLATVTPLPRDQAPMHAQTAVNSIAGDLAATANSATESSNAVAGASTRKVAVHVTGLKRQSSNLYVAVFDSAQGFPKPEHSRETTTIPVTADALEFPLSLPDLTAIGVAVFQDLNGDGKLTKNSFGLPLEPYGFSNNVRPTFGPPSFSQAAFRVSDSTTLLEIRVQ
jgi:uncharacterized protein (DUF2141 family)